MFERTNVEHRISSPYHPQTNGLDERMNQTLIHALMKLSKSNKEWDHYIDAALYAYRIGIQDSSRFSPFFLLYNRHPQKAIDYELKTANLITDKNISFQPSVSCSGDLEPMEVTMQELTDLRKQYHQRAYKLEHS